MKPQVLLILCMTFKFAMTFVIPSSPQNLTILKVTSTSIRFSWLQPIGSNVKYNIYYKSDDQTEFVSLTNDPKYKRSENLVFYQSRSYYNRYYTIRNLSRSWNSFMQLWVIEFSAGPYTDYKIAIVSKRGHRRNESVPFFQRTDVASPSIPILLMLNCEIYKFMDSEATVMIRWMRPQLYNKTIDYYIIRFSATIWDTPLDHKLKATKGEKEIEVYLWSCILVII